MSPSSLATPPSTSPVTSAPRSLLMLIGPPRGPRPRISGRADVPVRVRERGDARYPSRDANLRRVPRNPGGRPLGRGASDRHAIRHSRMRCLDSLDRRPSALQ
ncbi:hypothetical protein UK82_07570 [Frankia sp. ACN1ag]|nr:hypothetical protein UK82_07570 [Frankia sp. ACN1ag]